LVFINTCFSLSFASLFFLGAEVLQNPLQYMWWIPLPTYLILVVWQQYSHYYIPLQYQRHSPEGDLEELCTYCITLILGLIGIACAKLPDAVLPLLVVLIILNLWKTQQMRNALRSAKHPPEAAIEEIAHQSRKLWLNLIILLNLLHILTAWKHSLSPVALGIVGGTISIPLNIMARRLYKERYPDYRPDHVKYANALAGAFDGPGPARG
jgi:hypothetical protein